MAVIRTEQLRLIFDGWAEVMHENKVRLIELDSVGGDSDLGLTMDDGFSSARKAVYEYEGNDLGKLMYAAGKAILKDASSSMGTLIGSGLTESAKTLKGKEELTEAQICLIPESIEAGVMKLGEAKPGDKTFLDGIHPGTVELKKITGAQNLSECLQRARSAALEAPEKARSLEAKFGRLARREDKAVGITDPGSVVGALLIVSMCDSLVKMI